MAIVPVVPPPLGALPPPAITWGSGSQSSKMTYPLLHQPPSYLLRPTSRTLVTSPFGLWLQVSLVTDKVPEVEDWRVGTRVTRFFLDYGPLCKDEEHLRSVRNARPSA